MSNMVDTKAPRGRLTYWQHAPEGAWFCLRVGSTLVNRRGEPLCAMGETRAQARSNWQLAEREERVKVVTN